MDLTLRPATKGEDVDAQKSDTVNLTKPATKGLYIGVGGTLKITTTQGSTIAFTGTVPAGFLPIAVKRVWSTGSAATNIVALRI